MRHFQNITQIITHFATAAIDARHKLNLEPMEAKLVSAAQVCRLAARA
jgi:hypothetical protein